MPAPNGETSVFIFSRFKPEETFDRLMEKVAKERGKKCYAQASFLAEAVDHAKTDVKGCKLKLILDEKKHKHHANIVGWPEDKGAQKLLSQSLAAKAEKL